MKKILFAAIDVGSYEIAMKIFQMSDNGIKQLEHLRHRIDLGSSSYAYGKIPYEKIEEVCNILDDFKSIMNSYNVDTYKAYGTSALREIDNTIIVLDRIKVRTGIDITVLSNSEQRYLDYKALAAINDNFNYIIEDKTAIMDIGGGSVQLSLFDKDSLVTTQNMKMGVLRLKENIKNINSSPYHMESLLDEMVESQLSLFKKLYIKDKEITNLIIIDDYISIYLDPYLDDKDGRKFISDERFIDIVKKGYSLSRHEIPKYLPIEEDNIEALLIAGGIVKKAIETFGIKTIYAPGFTLCDGIAYDYAIEKKILKPSHNFEQDIIACAENICKRYQGSRKRGETLSEISLAIFDCMKKIHGLGKRERLLLHLCAILHDCGKYISFAQVGECSYNIVMNTEIIGLSHTEREIIANVVKFNHEDFLYYEEMAKDSLMDRNTYLTIAKLTAILRVANGLDRSHKQKFKDIRINLDGNELIIHVDSTKEIELEKGLFVNKAKFFEEVYNIKPIIKQKRKL